MNAANRRVEDCKSTTSVNAYADGELEASRAVEVEQHLVACRSCREELELIKAMRQGLRRSTTRTAPAALADRLRLVVAGELEAPRVEEHAGRPSMSVAAAPPPREEKAASAGDDARERLRGRLSWGATMTFAAAAGFVVAFFGSRSEWLHPGAPKSSSLESNATPPAPLATGLFAVSPSAEKAQPERQERAGFDALIDRLVSFHANPPPPEVEDFDQAAHRFEPLVGVHMPGTALRRPLGASFNGARIYDMDVRPADDAHYTAALRYTMQGHRITIYVFNPSVVPIQVTRLHPRMVPARPTLAPNGVVASAQASHDVPVYVGRVRGFSVAAAEESGIGYAVASDLDDDKSAQFVANFQ